MCTRQTDAHLFIYWDGMLDVWATHALDPTTSCKPLPWGNLATLPNNKNSPQNTPVRNYPYPQSLLPREQCWSLMGWLPRTVSSVCSPNKTLSSLPRPNDCCLMLEE